MKLTLDECACAELNRQSVGEWFKKAPQAHHQGFAFPISKQKNICRQVPWRNELFLFWQLWNVAFKKVWMQQWSGIHWSQDPRYSIYSTLALINASVCWFIVSKMGKYVFEQITNDDIYLEPQRPRAVVHFPPKLKCTRNSKRPLTLCLWKEMKKPRTRSAQLLLPHSVSESNYTNTVEPGLFAMAHSHRQTNLPFAAGAGIRKSIEDCKI